MASRLNPQSQLTDHSAKSTASKCASPDKNENPNQRSHSNVSLIQPHLPAVALLFLLALLLLPKSIVASPIVLSTGGNANTDDDNVLRPNISQQLTDQLVESYCVPPSADHTTTHKLFGSKTANMTESLNELRNELNTTIKRLVKDFKDHLKSPSTQKGNQRNKKNADPETLPSIELSTALEHLMPVLNQLETIRLQMLAEAKLGATFHKLNNVQTELSEWVKLLHRKLLQHSIAIDCANIRAVLHAPYRTVAKKHRLKDHTVQTVHKVEALLAGLDRMFVTALERLKGGATKVSLA